MKNTLFLLCILTTTVASARDVVLTAQQLGHTTFHDAVHAADLYKHAKKQAGTDGSLAPFTVFVPTNKAFREANITDPAVKKRVITYHVVPGQEITDVRSIGSDGVPTVGEELLQSNGLTVGLEESSVRANIVQGPIKADNGVVYVVDKVITPADMQGAKPDVTQRKEAVVSQPATHPVTPGAQSTHSAPSPQTTVTNEQIMQSVTQLTQSIQLLIHVIQQKTIPQAHQPTSVVPGVRNVVVR